MCRDATLPQQATNQEGTRKNRHIAKNGGASTSSERARDELLLPQRKTRVDMQLTRGMTRVSPITTPGIPGGVLQLYPAIVGLDYHLQGRHLGCLGPLRPDFDDSYSRGKVHDMNG